MNSKELKQGGFIGFKMVKELRRNPYEIPQSMGVYAVLYTDDIHPVFVERGVGGFFKGKDPNVSVSELETNWVENTDIVYIGKAGGMSSKATLQSRLIQYLKFGMGKNIGHWGGRYIWQLANADELVICWKPTDDEPREVEAKMIAQFKAEHQGLRPFANLTD